MKAPAYCEYYYLKKDLKEKAKNFSKLTAQEVIKASQKMDKYIVSVMKEKYYN